MTCVSNILCPYNSRLYISACGYKRRGYNSKTCPLSIREKYNEFNSDSEEIFKYSSEILSQKKNIFEINDPNIVEKISKIKENFGIEDFYNIFDGIKRANRFAENIDLFFQIITDFSQVGFLRPTTQEKLKNELNDQLAEKTKKMIKNTDYYKIASSEERVLLLITIDIIIELSKEKVNI